LDGRVAKPRPTPKIALRPVVYIIVRGPGIDQPIRCSSAADYYQALLSVISDQALHVDMVSTFGFAGIETHP
jgi:hypothetical protein